MKLLLVDNIHLYKTPEGLYYTPSIYNYEFFQRYLNVFDEIRLLCKVKHSNNLDINNFILVSRDRLEVLELPWYQGLKEMLKKFHLLSKIYKYASDECDCIIYRVAQIESFWTYSYKLNRKKAFALEIVNDPLTFTSMPKIFKKFASRLLKHMAKKANGVSYVTSNYLQGVYPSYSLLHGESHKHFHSYYSSINLDENMFISDYLIPEIPPLKIIHVANTMNGNIKGHLTLISIVEKLIKSGYSVICTFIGDGPSYEDYKKEIIEKKLEKHFNLVGRLKDKKEIFDLLQKAHLFIYPTKMEGLPRSLIEAMACGLPCLSSPIAGIPELLEYEYLFDSNDIQGFTRMIMFLYDNPEKLYQMSIYNKLKATEFYSNILAPRRYVFYKKFRDFVEESVCK